MSERRWLWLILLLYTLLALGYSLLMPAWEAPDETAHYLYVVSLAREGRPPTYDETYEAIQPPTYYWLVSPLFRVLDQVDRSLIQPYRPPLSSRDAPTRYDWQPENYRFLWGAHLLRWLNIPLGGLTILLTYYGAGRFTAAVDRFARPRQTPIPLATAALVGLLPQFLHNTAAISNDSLANLVGALLFWLLGLVCFRPLAGWQLVGLMALALAAPFLVKLTILPMALTMLAAVAWQARHFWRPRWAWLLAGGLLLGLGIVVALALLAPSPENVAWRSHWSRQVHVREDFFTRRPLWWMVTTYLNGYWGRLAWGAVGLPGNLVLILTGLAGLGWLASLRLLLAGVPLSRLWVGLLFLVGLLLAAGWLAVRQNEWWRVPLPVVVGFLLLLALAWVRQRQADPAQLLPLNRDAWTMLWLAAGLALLMIIRNTLTTPQYQGRFLFPTLGPLSLLMTAGWYVLLPRRAAGYLPQLVLVVLLGLNVYLWLAKAIPVYYQPFLD